MPQLDSSIEISILDALENESLTISELADEIDINRVTASKYLAVMEAKEKVKFRKIGNAKLYSVMRK